MSLKLTDDLLEYGVINKINDTNKYINNIQTHYSSFKLFKPVTAFYTKKYDT